MQSNFSTDVEDDRRSAIFEDQLVRMAFIKKVYFILTIQLLITLGFISIFILVEELQDFVAEYPSLLLIAIAVLFITIIAMACCPDVRRNAPGSYIFLAIFTISQSFLLGVICSIYDPITVLTAVCLTAAICFGLTIFAMQTKWDFTTMGAFLYVSLLVGVICLILSIFFYNRILQLILCSLGVILFSLHLIFDTQLMLGGQHQYSIRPDEYAFGALNLYLDIINLFLCMLRLIKC